jgi:hypothetical protein
MKKAAVELNVTGHWLPKLLRHAFSPSPIQILANASAERHFFSR